MIGADDGLPTMWARATMRQVTARLRPSWRTEGGRRGAAGAHRAGRRTCRRGGQRDAATLLEEGAEHPAHQGAVPDDVLGARLRLQRLHGVVLGLSGVAEQVPALSACGHHRQTGLVVGVRRRHRRGQREEPARQIRVVEVDAGVGHRHGDVLQRASGEVECLGDAHDRQRLLRPALRIGGRRRRHRTGHRAGDGHGKGEPISTTGVRATDGEARLYFGL